MSSTSFVSRSAPLDLSLIKCLFLLAGVLLNICSTFRRAFMTSYFGLSNAQFSLFMSFTYPVSFGAGLCWTLLHKRSAGQFDTIRYASFGALVCFLGTLLIPRAAKLLFCLLMLGYVAFSSAIIPIICIWCFQSLRDRTYFGQNFVFTVAGSMLVTQVVQFVCGMSKNQTSHWFLIYPLAAAIHILFLVGVTVIETLHKRGLGLGEKVAGSTLLSTSQDSQASGKDSGEFDESNDLEANTTKSGQPLYFDNSPYASNLSGSSFAFTKRINPFGTQFKQRTKTEFSTPKQTLWQNKRFIAVVTCAFLISLSSNLMKILLPSYLEDYVRVNSLVETFIQSGSSVAEFVIMVTFPWISKQLSYQSCFLSAISIYFLYMTCFSMLPTSALLKGTSDIGQRVVSIFIICAPLKGIASGLMNCSSSLLVSCITVKDSGAQKIYSAIVSMMAGCIAGLYGFWLALESDSLPLETCTVFRHCFLWCFVALLFAFYVFLLEKPESACRNQNYRYEALLLENPTAE